MALFASIVTTSFVAPPVAMPRIVVSAPAAPTMTMRDQDSLKAVDTMSSTFDFAEQGGNLAPKMSYRAKTGSRTGNPMMYGGMQQGMQPTGMSMNSLGYNNPYGGRIESSSTQYNNGYSAQERLMNRMGMGGGMRSPRGYSDMGRGGYGMDGYGSYGGMGSYGRYGGMGGGMGGGYGMRGGYGGGYGMGGGYGGRMNMMGGGRYGSYGGGMGRYGGMGGGYGGYGGMGGYGGNMPMSGMYGGNMGGRMGGRY